MQLSKIHVENFRLLKRLTFYPELDLSLIIGKNNVGKTSFLVILDKFLNSAKSKFSFEDLNVDLQKELCQAVSGLTEFKECAISLRLTIEYLDSDNISRLEPLLTNLDSANNYVVIGLDYILTDDAFETLKKDYNKFIATIDDSNPVAVAKKSEKAFLSRFHSKYFKLRRRSIEYDLASKQPNEKKYIDLDKNRFNLESIICIKHITAKRNVANTDIDGTLSGQISRLYRRSEDTGEEIAAVELFKDRLIATDTELSIIYKDIFSKILSKITLFGGSKSAETQLSVMSTLQHLELLDSNTTVMYNQSGHTLPESFNGLGYMNLLSIIFEIELILGEIRGKVNEIPSEINLLVIEEPEAHTHPQLQYVFIKNIKKLIAESLLRDDGVLVNLQTIISTHSAHIVAESQFDDIKYFVKNDTNSVSAKNLRDLETYYDGSVEKAGFRFLKQYLTLHRAELFFADKCVLVEGETERILMPAFFKKIDQTGTGIPLMSQNISVVEVGAHSKIFEKLLRLIGVKTVIVTDIDSAYDEVELDANLIPIVDAQGVAQTRLKKCPASSALAKYSTNSTLKYFYSVDDVAALNALTFNEKKLDWDGANWKASATGQVYVAYQTKDLVGYCARSFEDAFISLNDKFFKSAANDFPSVTAKWLEKYRAGTIDAFGFAEKGIAKKPSFAIEILMNSDEKFSQWEIPEYIREALVWLGEEATV